MQKPWNNLLVKHANKTETANIMGKKFEVIAKGVIPDLNMLFDDKELKHDMLQLIIELPTRYGEFDGLGSAPNFDWIISSPVPAISREQLDYSFQVGKKFGELEWKLDLDILRKSNPSLMEFSWLKGIYSFSPVFQVTHFYQDSDYWGYYKNVSTIIRSNDVGGYDIFISYASEDKEKFVRPLANALIDGGLRVWYDEYSIRLGDSITESIERGLSKSQCAAIVLSKYFFQKKWPRKELNYLVNMSSQDLDGPLMIPIWLGVTTEQIAREVPLLLDISSIMAQEDEFDGVSGRIINRLRHRND